MTLALEDVAYRRAQDQVGRIHGELVDEQRTLTLVVDSLLAGGWRGVAADQFAEGWAEWAAGLGLVLEGLAEMGAALEATRQRLLETDLVRAEDLTLVQGRIRG